METENANILLGELIRQRRIDRGMSQEEFAGTVYSHSQISRIENGTSFPSYEKLQKLLQTLGLEDDLFYGLRNQAKMKITLLQEEALLSCIHFEHATGDERHVVWSDAMKKLRELEGMVSDSDHLTQQFIIHCKIILGKEGGVPYNPEERLSFLMRAIRLTVPRFDIERINDSLYYFNEIKIINQIALAYSRGGDHDTAIDIFRQLLKYVETHNQGIRRSAGYLPLVAHNYARELTIAGRYREAVKVGDKGWKISVSRRYYEFLGGLAHTMAECHHYLGNEAKSKDLFHLAYGFYRMVGDYPGIIAIKADAQKCLGLELDDYEAVSLSSGTSSPSPLNSGEMPGPSAPSLSEFW